MVYCSNFLNQGYMSVVARLVPYNLTGFIHQTLDGHVLGFEDNRLYSIVGDGDSLELSHVFELPRASRLLR